MPLAPGDRQAASSTFKPVIIDEFKQKILDKLEENYGFLYLTDDSSPEEIKEELQMSKKNFKKAIGGLYKENVIEILDDKIKLINEE